MTEVGRDKEISPIRVSQREHPLKRLPVAACPDHKRSLDSLWILAADDGGGKIAGAVRTRARNCPQETRD